MLRLRPNLLIQPGARTKHHQPGHRHTRADLRELRADRQSTPHRKWLAADCAVPGRLRAVRRGRTVMNADETLSTIKGLRDERARAYKYWETSKRKIRASERAMTLAACA